MDEVSLGRALQAARKRAGLTQQELCQRAGLSYSTLAKIERGAIKAPSIFTIQSIATALDITLADLLGDVKGAKSNKKLADGNKRRSRSGVRFVYFDINGCLVRFFHRAFARLSEASGVPADVVETTFWHYNDEVCRGEMTMEEFNRIFAERLGMKGLDWQDYYLKAIDPIDEMKELVAWAGKHYRIGLLSNIMPGLIDAMFEKKILPDVTYNAIIDSSKIGAIKPEPRIYEVAQEWAGCLPEEILLIDDSRANLMAAEHMGWHVLWFDDFRPEESAAHVKAALKFE